MAEGAENMSTSRDTTTGSPFVLYFVFVGVDKKKVSNRGYD